MKKAWEPTIRQEPQRETRGGVITAHAGRITLTGNRRGGQIRKLRRRARRGGRWW